MQAGVNSVLPSLPVTASERDNKEGDVSDNNFDDKKGMFSYSAVSSPLDRSERFTLHSLADLFIPTPNPFLWEAFSHAAITGEDYSLTFPSPSNQVLIYTAEWPGASWREQKCINFETVEKGIRTWALDCESCILQLSYCCKASSK